MIIAQLINTFSLSLSHSSALQKTPSNAPARQQLSASAHLSSVHVHPFDPETPYPCIYLHYLHPFNLPFLLPDVQQPSFAQPFTPMIPGVVDTPSPAPPSLQLTILHFFPICSNPAQLRPCLPSNPKS